MVLLYMYLGIGVIACLCIMVYIRYQRWLVDNDRGYNRYSNDDTFSYLLAVTVAIPVINLYWVFTLLRFFWEELKKPCYPE